MNHRLLHARLDGPGAVWSTRARIGWILDRAACPPEQAAAVLTGFSSGALELLGTDGAAEASVGLSRDRYVLNVALSGASGGVWSQSAELDRPVGLPVEEPPGPEADLLARQAPSEDARTSALLHALGERERDLSWYRAELDETNQGVLALHAELAEAGEARERLLDAERAARLEAEAARSRLTFLASAGGQLMATLQGPEIVLRAEKLLVSGYARSAKVWPADADGTMPEEHEGLPVPEIAVWAAQEREVLSRTRPGGGRVHGFPLLAGSRLTGVMTVLRDGGLGEDRVLLAEFARRVAVALDNARRYEHERDTAATLQRSMLTRLPRIPGVSLAARYLPATRGMNVGGDWYDVFEVGDGEYLAVVGDVTGHGIQAAVMMGQLRTALRAYALQERSPGLLLGRLHELVESLAPDLFATAVLLRFSRGDPEVVAASAGHPPPLLRSARGVERVEVPPGPMLGLPLDVEFEESRLLLDRDEVLMVYTDGLVERRGEQIDDGIDRLASAYGAQVAVARDPDTAADGVLRTALHGHDCDDDVCLLMLAPGAGGV